MSITLPSYTRREMPLQSRRHRILAIVLTGLKREFRRPAAIFPIGVGAAVTMITSIFFLLFAGIFLQGRPVDLSFFYLTASNGAILFFVTLMAAIVGSGLIADDLNTMALSLYLSRPITHADYLLAKTSILVPLVAMIGVLPLVLTPFLAAILGLVPWTTGLVAIVTSFFLGLVLTAFYASVALFLSSLTRRKAYAAAGVFAVTFGLTVPAETLASVTSTPSLLYLSPWEDFLAVARAAYGAEGAPIDWPVALAILLGTTIVAALVTYIRIQRMEVVSG
ncbi:MAG TPA: ABC transporter permease subunit [Thermoplasmata archaeon]|nr:ABC transporter permease subunit [Thermoplasmata archaeon]